MGTWLKSNRQSKSGWHVDLRRYIEKAAKDLLDKWSVAQQHPKTTTVGPGDIATFDTTDFHCRPAGCETHRIAIFATFRLRDDETDSEWTELKTSTRNAHLQANQTWTTESPLNITKGDSEDEDDDVATNIACRFLEHYYRCHLPKDFD
jgi:hypothetical protein